MACQRLCLILVGACMACAAPLAGQAPTIGVSTFEARDGVRRNLADWTAPIDRPGPLPTGVASLHTDLPSDPENGLEIEHGVALRMRVGSRRRYVGTGILIGAAAGLVGGLLIERNQTSPCHDCIRVDGLPLYTTLIGGILGGLSGLMVHAIRTIGD